MVIYEQVHKKMGVIVNPKKIIHEQIHRKIEPKIIPKKTLKTSSVGEHQDILQLPKEGSTKLYTIIAVIALIIIFFEAKIFKKLVK